MKTKGIIFEDTVNYKKTCMTISMPYCTFKCGKKYCQNSKLAKAPIVEIVNEKIISRYITNGFTHALCFQGLEPMDSIGELLEFIPLFRKYSQDDIVIYTGYTEQECNDNRWIDKLKIYPNIIIKFGRFIPNQEPHYDEVLGVKLISDNQYAKKIS